MPTSPYRDTELLRLLTSYMPAFTISAALKLGVMESMGDSAVPTKELARVTATHEPSLTKMLRALAALGLMTEDEPDTFRLTPRGDLLRPGVPGSMYGWASVFLDESMWGAWPALDHAVKTGESAFQYVYGTDYMSHTGWADRSELREHVDVAMIDETRSVATHVLAAYDFGPFTTVVDIGGGSGPLISAVLAANPHLSGILFDQPDGIAYAPRVLAEAGVENRCEIQTGDFFSALPAGDLYLCKSVLFNWPDDDQVAKILGNCRREITESGRLLLVEQMLPAKVDDSVPPHVYVDDLNSIVSLGGRHRTEPEYRALLTATGFTMTAQRLPVAGYSLLEATPAVD